MAAASVSSKSRDVEQVPHEKDQAVHEEFRQGGLAQDDLDFLANFSDEKRKKVLRKVDVSVEFLASLFRNIGN